MPTAPIRVWQIWFTHSDCSQETWRHANNDETCSVDEYFDDWTLAAAEIERRLTHRPAGCVLDAIVGVIAFD
jgi:hypothetical protein